MPVIRIQSASDGEQRWGRPGGGAWLLLPPLARVRRVSVARSAPSHLLRAWRTGLLWEQFLRASEPLPSGWRMDPGDDFSSTLTLAFCPPPATGDPWKGRRRYAPLQPDLAAEACSSPALAAGRLELDEKDLVPLQGPPWLFAGPKPGQRALQAGLLALALGGFAQGLGAALPGGWSAVLQAGPPRSPAQLAGALLLSPAPSSSKARVRALQGENEDLRRALEAAAEAAHSLQGAGSDAGQVRLVASFAELVGKAGQAWRLERLETEGQALRVDAVFASTRALEQVLAWSGGLGLRASLRSMASLPRGRVGAGLVLGADAE